MAQLRLDDPSPFIHYDETFRMATPYGDGAIDQYSDGGTYHATKYVNSAATITFNGTGITIYGAKRFNHDSYTVNLDGEDTIGQGYSKENSFDNILYNRQNLNNGPHTVKLSNTPTNPNPNKSYWVDIDYVVLTTEVVDKSVKMDHSKFRYEPENAWTTNNEIVGVPNDVSLHAVKTKGASATVFFTGSAIDLYGVVCPTCGSYSVNLDGVPQSSKPFNTSTGAGEWTKTSQVFFSARNLDDSPHVLRITTLDDQPVALQEAVVFSALDSSASNSNNSGSLLSNGDNGSQKGGLPSSVIVGIILGVVMALILLLAAVLTILRRRRRRNQPNFSQWPHPLPAQTSGATERYSASDHGSSEGLVPMRQPSSHTPSTWWSSGSSSISDTETSSYPTATLPPSPGTILEPYTIRAQPTPPAKPPHRTDIKVFETARRHETLPPPYQRSES